MLTRAPYHRLSGGSLSELVEEGRANPAREEARVKFSEELEIRPSSCMAAADTPSPSNSSQSSVRDGSESRHKVELVARRLSIVLLYLVLLVGCLVVGLLYFVLVWPAKK